MPKHPYCPRLVAIMRAHDLGGLVESDGPIGAAYEAAIDVLCDAEVDDVTEPEAETIGIALDALDACYDPESGYAYNAPDEHAAISEVVTILQSITKAHAP